MRYQEIKYLLEYDRTKTQQALGNGIVGAAKGDSYLISKQLPPEGIIDAVVKQAEAADPTANKQNVQWIIKQFIKQGMKYEDMYKLKADLAVFASTKGQHKRLGINSDINSYNWKTLAATAQKLDNTDLVEPTDSTQGDGPVADAKVLYNGPLGILSIPGTEAASCELGKGTKWCTSSTGDENNNMFDYYNDKGSLYVWQDKKLKTKFQFHFETAQFMDAQDVPLDDKAIQYLSVENPVTSKLFKKEGPTVINAYVKFLKAEIADPDGSTNQDNDEILDATLMPVMLDNLSNEVLIDAAYTAMISERGKEQLLPLLLQRFDGDLDLRTQALKKHRGLEREYTSYVIKDGTIENAIKYLQSAEMTSNHLLPFWSNRLSIRANQRIPELEKEIQADSKTWDAYKQRFGIS